MVAKNRNAICIPIKNYLNTLSSIGKLIKNNDNLRILFCSDNLTDDIKNKINKCFKSSVMFYNYSDKIEDNEILTNIYQICIIKDFESHFNLIPHFVEHIQESGTIYFISNEISIQGQEINYKLSHFSKRFFNQLKLKAGLTTFKSLKENFSIPTFDDTELISNSLPKKEIAKYPVELCRTSGQKHALEVIIKSFEKVYVPTGAQKSIQSSVSLVEGLTGRGKCSVITLGIASAIKYGLADIYVIGPNKTSLDKCCNNITEALLCMEYSESTLRVRYQDKYFILEVSIDSSTQKIRFINFDQEFSKYDTGLLCILEAGQLSDMKINKMLSFNPKLVWVSMSTGGINSTGSTTYNQMCRPFRAFCGIGETLPNDVEEVKKSGVIIREITNKADHKTYTSISMSNPIIYDSKDKLESCINEVFCLQRKIDRKYDEKSQSNFFPEPNDCDLMYVNKTTLFSGHAAAEIMLERFIDVYTSFEHKRTSDFLQDLSNDPAQHLFCLQQPSKFGKFVPEILCIAHIAVEERQCESKTLMGQLQRNTSLLELKNAKSLRIIRLITQGKFKKLGYARHMLKVLHKYFSQHSKMEVSEHVLNGTQIVHRSLELPPVNEMGKLLVNINDLPPAPFKTDYISCQFPADHTLLCFWKKCEFFPVHISAQSKSEMLCVMMRDCRGKSDEKLDEAAYQEMCENVGSKILHDLRDIDVNLVHEILFNRNKFNMTRFKECNLEDVANCLDNRQLKKLDSFVQNIHTFESIQDIIYYIAQIYFGRKLSGLHLAKYQELTLVGFGFQLKSSKQLATEMILMERYQNTNTIDPFKLRKDVQLRIPLLLSHVRECARVFLNHVTKIIDDYDTNQIPEKKRRLM